MSPRRARGLNKVPAERPSREADVRPRDAGNNVNLLVDGILAHSVDTMLVYMCADTLAAQFRDLGVTKILTTETGGISLGFAVAMCLSVNLVYARKKPLRHTDNVISRTYRKKGTRDVGTLYVAADFVVPGDRIVIVDCFLASGSTLQCLARLAHDGGAEVVGVGVLLEKCYKSQAGRQVLSDENCGRIFSLLRILSLDGDGNIAFDEGHETNMASDMLRAKIVDEAAIASGWGVD